MLKGRLPPRSDRHDLTERDPKFSDNSFSLTSPSVDNIGVVISPPAALINHSCTPNAVVVFPEGGEGAGKRAGKEWVRIVAIRPIAADEEVLTSYVDLAATGRERRAELRERYFFECRCPACLAEPTATEPDPRDMLKCPECTTWFQPPGRSSLIHRAGLALTGPSLGRRRDALEAGVETGDAQPGRRVQLRAQDRRRTVGGAGQARGDLPVVQLLEDHGYRRPAPRHQTVRRRPERSRLPLYRCASLPVLGRRTGADWELAADPAKAAHYADRAIDWLQLKLSPFTCNGAFFPILDLRRLKFTAQLLSKKDRAQLLAESAHDIPKILDGLQRVYGPGHPVTAVTKATVAKLFVEALYARRGYEIEDPDVIMPSLKTIRERYLDALEDLCVGLGPNARVTRVAAEAVSMIEKDLAWWEKVAKGWDEEEVERRTA